MPRDRTNPFERATMPERNRAQERPQSLIETQNASESMLVIETNRGSEPQRSTDTWSESEPNLRSEYGSLLQ